jgi:hypothetical protein
MPFIFGLLAAAMALLTQLIVWLFYPPLFEVTLPLRVPVLTSLFLMAFIEEGARVLFARQYQKSFGRAQARMVLGFALGFASLEALFAFSQNSLEKALLIPVAIHILLTFLAFLGLQRITRKISVFALFSGLVLIHFLFNTSLLFF